jgi:hypothetical protein
MPRNLYPVYSNSTQVLVEDNISRTESNATAAVVTLASRLGQCTMSTPTDTATSTNDTNIVASTTTTSKLIHAQHTLPASMKCPTDSPTPAQKTRRASHSRSTSTDHTVGPVATSTSRRRHHPYASQPRLVSASPEADSTSDNNGVCTDEPAHDSTESRLHAMITLDTTALPGWHSHGSTKPAPLTITAAATSPRDTTSPTSMSASVRAATTTMPLRCRRGRRNAIGDIARELALIQRACRLYGY